MGRQKRGRGRELAVGPYALIAAVFELAMRDVAEGNGDCEEAREFLEGPRGEFYMDVAGVTPGYYRRLLDMPDNVYAGEVEERLLWMVEVMDFTREEAGWEVWGEMSKFCTSRVAGLIGNKYTR